MEPLAHIAVTLDAEGQVGVQIKGTRADMITLLGLLESAKAIVLSRVQATRNETSPIVLARANGMPRG